MELYSDADTKETAATCVGMIGNFLKLSLQQCTQNDYMDKAKVKKHNTASKKIHKLMDEMEPITCENIMYILLNHEDDRVKVNAASLCLKSGVFVDQSVLALNKIINVSNDPTLRFSAKLLLQSYRQQIVTDN